MNSRLVLLLSLAPIASSCSTASGPTSQTGTTGASSGYQASSSGASGSASGASSSGSGTGASSGGASGDVTTGSGTGAAGGTGASSSGSVVASGSAGGSGASGAASGSSSGAASGSPSPEGGSPSDSGPGSLPDGSINAIPAGYKGTPYKGVMAQIPGTVYARNYDVGGQGVGFNHPGTPNCGDWPGGMAMYRTGPDCVGLSVESAGKGDVTLTGAPAMYGEIYISYCAAGEWLNYTVQVLESGTYAVGLNVGAPGGLTVSFDFSAVPVATTGKLAIPASVDQAQPGHEMYHVWQTVNKAGTVVLQAGTYVMKFTIATANGNFDSFTFTKM